jgi:hypothetical protein
MHELRRSVGSDVKIQVAILLCTNQSYIEEELHF